MLHAQTTCTFHDPVIFRHICILGPRLHLELQRHPDSLPVKSHTGASCEVASSLLPDAHCTASASAMQCVSLTSCRNGSCSIYSTAFIAHWLSIRWHPQLCCSCSLRRAVVPFGMSRAEHIPQDVRHLGCHFCVKPWRSCCWLLMPRCALAQHRLRRTALHICCKQSAGAHISCWHCWCFLLRTVCLQRLARCMLEITDQMRVVCQSCRHHCSRANAWLPMADLRR